jgi:hypothetical protein
MLTQMVWYFLNSLKMTWQSFPNVCTVFHFQMYDEWSSALEEAAQDESVHFVVITGMFAGFPSEMKSRGNNSHKTLI